MTVTAIILSIVLSLNFLFSFPNVRNEFIPSCYFLALWCCPRLGSSGESSIASQCMPLHTAAVPAVRAAARIEPSYRNNTIIAFFLAANKNEDNAKRALASSDS